MLALALMLLQAAAPNPEPPPPEARPAPDFVAVFLCTFGDEINDNNDGSRRPQNGSGYTVMVRDSSFTSPSGPSYSVEVDDPHNLLGDARLIYRRLRPGSPPDSLNVAYAADGWPARSMAIGLKPFTPARTLRDGVQVLDGAILNPSSPVRVGPCAVLQGAGASEYFDQQRAVRQSNP
jgi:hypothetical protein